MIALVLFAATSFASDNPVDLTVELGSTAVPDPDFDIFADRGAVGNWGARVGLGFSENLSLLVDWQHSATGGSVRSTADERSFYSALTLDHLAVGPRFGVPIGDMLVPYVTVQAEGIRGRYRFDEDIQSTDDPNERQGAALTAGGLAMVGAQLLAGAPDQDIRFLAHLEMGYGLAAPLSFDDLGSIAIHGFALRAGAGVMF